MHHVKKDMSLPEAIVKESLYEEHFEEYFYKYNTYFLSIIIENKLIFEI